MSNTELLKKVTKIIVDSGAEKIILFGSIAWGIPNEDSDIDLLVIKDIPENRIRDYRIKLKKTLWENLKNRYKAFDIIVDSEERIKNRIAIGDLFYKEIYTKGKVLYA